MFICRLALKPESSIGTHNYTRSEVILFILTRFLNPFVNYQKFFYDTRSCCTFCDSYNKLIYFSTQIFKEIESGNPVIDTIQCTWFTKFLWINSFIDQAYPVWSKPVSRAILVILSGSSRSDGQWSSNQLISYKIALILRANMFHLTLNYVKVWLILVYLLTIPENMSDDLAAATHQGQSTSYGDVKPSLSD